jgi:hypothetical protein
MRNVVSIQSLFNYIGLAPWAMFKKGKENGLRAIVVIPLYNHFCIGNFPGRNTDAS